MSRHYSDWLRAYLDYTGGMESPTHMHWWTGVSAIAGALRRQVWIDQTYFRWYPNFYVLLVAPPGIISKSTTMNVGMRLLGQVPGVNFGPEVITWQELIRSFGEVTEMVPLPGGTYQEISCLTVASSELGVFLDIEDRKMLEMMVALWDGYEGYFSKATKTQGRDDIPNPWINWITATTPAWVEENFSTLMVHGGFVSRLIPIYASEKRHLIPYPGLQGNGAAGTMEPKLVEDLCRIAEIRGPYELSDEAIQFGDQWYRHYHNQTSSELDSDRATGYKARKQTHAHKLAMVLAASRRDDRIIHRSDLEEAIQTMTDLEKNIPTVFARHDQAASARTADKLADIVARHGPLKREQLYRHVWRRIPIAEFEAGLKAAKESGRLKTVTVGNATVYKDSP